MICRVQAKLQHQAKSQSDRDHRCTSRAVRATQYCNGRGLGNGRLENLVPILGNLFMDFSCSWIFQKTSTPHRATRKKSIHAHNCADADLGERITSLYQHVIQVVFEDMDQGTGPEPNGNIPRKTLQPGQDKTARMYNIDARVPRGTSHNPPARTSTTAIPVHLQRREYRMPAGLELFRF